MVVAGLLLYNSVYFRKLDAKPVTVSATALPGDFAEQFWKNEFKVYLDSAVNLTNLLRLLKTDPKQAVKYFSKKQGLGNTAYFLVKGEGIITAVNTDDVLVALQPGDDIALVKLNTGLYFGNAIRDVTGRISMGNFDNTMDYNTVSSTLNKIVQEEVIKPFKSKAVKGTNIQFIACAEVNTIQPDTAMLNLLPVRVNYK